MKEDIKLPKEVKINFNEIGVKCKKTPCGWFTYHPNFDLDDVILEHLSNEYGYCINSMSYELLLEKDIPIGFMVINIDWYPYEKEEE